MTLKKLLSLYKHYKNNYDFKLKQITYTELEEEVNGMKIGDWKKVKSFATLSEAQEYLDGLLTPVA